MPDGPAERVRRDRPVLMNPARSRQIQMGDATVLERARVMRKDVRIGGRTVWTTGTAPSSSVVHEVCGGCGCCGHVRRLCGTGGHLGGGSEAAVSWRGRVDARGRQSLNFFIVFGKY